MARHYYGHATAAVFAPLEPTSRAAQVAQRLSDAIALGLLAEATQLPGEVDLAATLGVSTVTVREALAGLRAEGLLQTRRGRGGGSFVTLPSGGTAELTHRRLLESTTQELRDLGDLYSTVAAGSAAYAARRRTPHDVVQLRAAGQAYASALEPGIRRRADAHLRVILATVAQSPRLYRAEIGLQAEIGTLLWLASDGEEVHRQDAAAVQALIDHIGLGEVESARTLAEDRVRRATARLVDLRIDKELL